MYFLSLQHQNSVSTFGSNLNGIWISRAKLHMHTDGQTFMNTSKKKINRVGVYSVSFPLFFSHHSRRAPKVATQFFFNLAHHLQQLYLVPCSFSEITDFMATKSRWLLDIRPFVVALLNLKQQSWNGVKVKLYLSPSWRGMGNRDIIPHIPNLKTG